MIKYDNDTIQEISNGVNLLEYISNYIDLKPKGKDHFGCCPLHTDITPSFSVTSNTNNFYCFSCGRGGGIIQYLVEYEALPFDKAIEKASKLAQFDLKKICQSQTVRLNKQLNRLKQPKKQNEHPIIDAQEYKKYRKGIVQEWLQEGIRQQEIDLFDIRLDHKSNRIVYPVYDISNNLINIKGRTRFKNYKKLGIAKYINYYPVGRMDYFQGAHKTYSYIKESGEMKIFESLKSVMKLFGYGIKDSVSAEKHNLTPEQIIWIIRSGAKNVIFCYDSDITYQEKEIQKNITLLKRFVNIYILEDKKKLLGGIEAKNSPIDKGIDIWNQLYSSKKKIT